MHTFMDAKLIAKLLRQALAERDIDISHSESLELVARQFGLANWNMLSARIEAAIASGDEIPKGWNKSGNNAKRYRVATDAGQAAAVIESKPGAETDLSEADFCTLMQAVDAAAYRGRRMRLSAELKAVGVQGGVTLWFRIDGPQGSLRFENLERYHTGGPIDGDSGWVARTIVLDVPEEASTLNFGFYLKGSGRGLARSLSLVAVGEDTPVNTPDAAALDAPINLDFRDVA